MRFFIRLLIPVILVTFSGFILSDNHHALLSIKQLSSQTKFYPEKKTFLSEQASTESNESEEYIREEKDELLEDSDFRVNNNFFNLLAADGYQTYSSVYHLFSFGDVQRYLYFCVIKI